MEEIKSRRVKRAHFVSLDPVRETCPQVRQAGGIASETFIYLPLFCFWHIFLKMPTLSCWSIPYYLKPAGCSQYLRWSTWLVGTAHPTFMGQHLQQRLQHRLQICRFLGQKAQSPFFSACWGML